MIFMKILQKINDDKWMQLIDSIETYAYETNKYLASEKDDKNSNNIIKQ